jgi:large subunit ribosomal protein L16
MAEYKIPKRMKYRKQQRGRMAGVATRGAEISFGEYGLKALEPAWITGKQIEASRVAMTRFVKRGGKIWIGFSPTSPSPRSPLKRVWEKARELLKVGWRLSSQVAFSLKWKA